MNGNAPILNASVSRAVEGAELLEERIRDYSAQIERLQRLRDATSNANLALGYRVRQQRFAREVARLVAQRTPETVARMEQERGLA